MLDQAFSAGNFQRIYDRENRRGRNVDRRFFPLLVEASSLISAASEKLRDRRRTGANLTKEELADALAPLYAALEAARANRDKLVDEAIKGVAAEASQKSFQLALETKGGPGGMGLYPLTNSAPSFFVAKQLQWNISRLYKVKQSDRRSIVRQVKDTLSTKFNLVIVRTDVTSFYESVDRSILTNDLDKDQLLSLASKAHIKCILTKYGSLSGQPKGIPRGVGVSAYLSELYMRSVDEQIRQIEGITFYARYVDDIIAVFSPTAMDDRAKYLTKIEHAVASRGLALNQTKTKAGPTTAGGSFAFDYLGYDFTAGNGKCELEMSDKKVNRYKGRISASFDAYIREAPIDQKGASRRLLSRIKFMTGNTRLINSKGFAFTGIYYNNSELTKMTRLTGLDAFLAYRTSQLSSAKLQNRIARHSFKAGFEKRPFYRYSTTAIATIVKVWSYEA